MGKRLQKWICLLLVLCMMVSMLPVIAAAETSADVIIEAEDCAQTTSGQWAEHSRKKGSSASAEHELDRTGEVSLKNGGANWYDNYVNYAVTNGIIEKDYANYTQAQMNAPVTRGEFVHIFHGAEEAYKAINTVADNAIPDVKTTDKFALEIYGFYRAGILTGSDAKGTFHSASTIKRSEAAAILLRMFEASARKSITLN